MRTMLLIGVTSALILSASLTNVSATTFDFTSQIVDYTVPDDGAGVYHIEASGAQGGTEPHSGNEDSIGGYGAMVQAGFNLTAGEVLRIAVGGKGGDGPTSAFDDGAGGGGGGTFVIGANNMPLLIAGGGGGGGAGDTQDGLSPYGLDARAGAYGGAAGTNGSGGLGGSSGAYPGGGGGGFSGEGSGGRGSGGGSGDPNGAGGNSFAGGLGGGGSGTRGGGGFGGGGGGGQGTESSGGGGGGGYNGGGGGGSFGSILENGAGGGSGGSFFDSSAFNARYSVATDGGDGSVTITKVSGPDDLPASVPEPASLALFGTGALSLCAFRRARWR